MAVKVKAQDFSISRKVYIKTSYSPNFEKDQTITHVVNVGMLVSEIKTNLDKTMYQEAIATAHELKTIAPTAKYFLLCEWLDMKPNRNELTDIDEVLLLRKAKRLNATDRASFGTSNGRKTRLQEYIYHLQTNPFAKDVFQWYLNCIFTLIDDEDVTEKDILAKGRF